MTERQRTPRIGALVPIRLASERLPGKALLPLAGRPVVAHLLDRVFAVPSVDPSLVVVCTTSEPGDDPLVAAVHHCGAQVFRGSRDDLIDRLASARDAFDLDIALQVDGDDPCADAGYMQRLITTLTDDHSADVAIVEGLPLGVASKAIRARAFATVRQAYRTFTNDTGFSYYFTKSGLSSVRTLQADPEDRDPVARLTLDYEEDMTFFRALFAALGPAAQVWGVRDIVRCLERHPEIRSINTGRTAEYWQRTADRTHLEFETPGSGVRRVIE